MATPSKNILWLSVSRIMALVLLFLGYTQLFRYLGPEAYGRLQFILSFTTLFGVIVDFGLQQYIIKKMSEDRSRVKEYFHNFLAVEIVLCSLVYGSMLLIAKLNGYDPIIFKGIVVAGLGVAITGLAYPFLTVMTSFYELKKVAFLNLLAAVVNVSFIFLTIWTGHSIILLVTQQVVYAVISIFLYYSFVQKFIGRPDVLRGISRLNWGLVKNMFAAAFPFALLVGFSTVYNRIDVVLITKILGFAQTGLYTAAYKLFDLLSFFPAVVSHALYPLFASMMAEGKIAEIRTTLERYLRFMLALALPLGVGGTLFAKQLILILAGPDFAPAAPVLAIIVWAPAILFVYIVANSIVISQLTKFAMVITGANVVVNIIGNIILLPRIGIRGAAIMTLASELFQGLFYLYFVRKKITRFRFVSLTWQPLVASLIMGGSLWLIQAQPLVLVIPAGVLIYGMVLWLLGFFKKDDLVFIKSLLSRAV